MKRFHRQIGLGLAYGIVLSGLSLCWWVPSYASQVSAMPDIRVIVHPDVDVEGLSRNGLRAIFGMRNRSWPQGELIRVFVLTDNNPTHISFTKQILRTFPYHLRRIWDRRVYSGTGQSPVVVNTEEEMHKLISLTDNAIGYVSSSWVSDDVKVLELK